MNKHTALILLIALLPAAASNQQPTAKATAQPAATETGQPAAATAQPDKSPQIRELLAEYHLPGIQLIYTHGPETEIYNLGTTGDSTHAITSNTIFEAASLSKCVFAYIVLRLYDRGGIDLDAVANPVKSLRAE
jgi:CubicO group peptidase (beta-lactamase class C family)